MLQVLRSVFCLFVLTWSLDLERNLQSIILNQLNNEFSKLLGAPSIECTAIFEAMENNCDPVTRSTLANLMRIIQIQDSPDHRLRKSSASSEPNMERGVASDGY